MDVGACDPEVADGFVGGRGEVVDFLVVPDEAALHGVVVGLEGRIVGERFDEFEIVGSEEGVGHGVPSRCG